MTSNSLACVFDHQHTWDSVLSYLQVVERMIESSLNGCARSDIESLSQDPRGAEVTHFAERLQMCWSQVFSKERPTSLTPRNNTLQDIQMFSVVHLPYKAVNKLNRLASEHFEWTHFLCSSRFFFEQCLNTRSSQQLILNPPIRFSQPSNKSNFIYIMAWWGVDSSLLDAASWCR